MIRTVKTSVVTFAVLLGPLAVEALARSSWSHGA
jgi:hypothetical protein